MESLRSRKLLDAESGQGWSSECVAERVIISVEKNGLEKKSEKVLSDASSALLFAEKEEWTKLKKGLVLNSSNVARGEPRMHRFLGQGFTGAMVIIGLDNGQLMCNQYDQPTEKDSLVFLSEDASISQVISLPEKHNLLWSAKFCRNQNRILLLVDHQILSLSLQTLEFEKLTNRNQNPASFLSLSGDLAAWYEEPDLVVHDLSLGKPVMRVNACAEKYGGHTLQMKAELSPDGATLACCMRSGEINIFDVRSGKQTHSLRNDFQMVKKLQFSQDSRYLLIHEQYGAWAVYCFDLQQGKSREGWPKLANIQYGDIAINNSGQLAIARHQQIEILDLSTMESVLRFRADHVSKSCAIGFVDQFIGIRTDSGCASLYALH